MSGTRTEKQRECLGKLLFEAVEDGCINDAQQAIDAGADINYQTDSGNTPLIQALLQKNHSMMTFLMENGADANIQNKSGYNPFLYAACMLDVETFQKLTMLSQKSLDLSNKANKKALEILKLYNYETDSVCFNQSIKRLSF